MKPILVSLSALLSLVALSHTQAATFKSKAYPYTLSVPDDWQSKKVPGVDVALAAPSSGSGVPASVNVAVTPVSAQLKVTLEDLRALMLKQAGENVKDFQLLGDAALTVGGLPGRDLIFSGTEQNVPMRWIQLVTLKDNVSYIVTFATAQASFDKDKKLINQVLNSFKITDSKSK